MESDAVIIDSFRYSLGRRWGDGGYVLYCMLNPSTADADVDDPTIRRCKGFAVAAGHNAIRVVNLYAFRTKSPATLKAMGYPPGPLNDEYIEREASDASKIVAAWGANAPITRAEAVFRILKSSNRDVFCLGRCGSGQPRHPLMVPSAQGFEPYST